MTKKIITIPNPEYHKVEEARKIVNKLIDYYIHAKNNQSAIQSLLKSLEECNTRISLLPPTVEIEEDLTPTQSPTSKDTNIEHETTPQEETQSNMSQNTDAAPGAPQQTLQPHLEGLPQEVKESNIMPGIETSTQQPPTRNPLPHPAQPEGVTPPQEHIEPPSPSLTDLIAEAIRDAPTEPDTPGYKERSLLGSDEEEYDLDAY